MLSPRSVMSAQRSCLRRALPYSCRCLRLCCSPAPCMRMVWPTAATRLAAGARRLTYCASCAIHGSARLAPSDVAITMIAAHAASRTAAMSYLITFDYVRPMGKAKPVVQRMRLPAALIAAMLGLPWLFWQGWQFGIVALGLLGVLRFAIGRWFVRRLGGYTGDCLGFAQQIFELAIYLVAAAWNLF